MSPDQPGEIASRYLAILAVGILLISLAGVSAQPSTVTNLPARLEIPVGQRQLFLDDFGIERIDKLTRTLHSPAKKVPSFVPTGSGVRRLYRPEAHPPGIRSPASLSCG